MLNKDILFLVLEELQNDANSLYSCLMVNRTWCEITVPMLWKNPYPTDITKMIKLVDVIFLHLSEESREILKNKEINLLTETSQRPLFNYISFWRYLNLNFLERLFTSITSTVESRKPILRNEILKLLIRNTKFTHIYLKTRFSYQLHLIPGAEHCFSELQYLLCYNDQNGLEELVGISKSIKKLDCFITVSNVTGIINLMEVQRHLKDVRFYLSRMVDESIHKILEESLIKHADTVQHLEIYWKPVTKFLPRLVNLMSLEINISYKPSELNSLGWSHLENVSFPGLKILKSQGVPPISLARLIENTKGHLTEIGVNYKYDDYKRLIQAISQSCPNLMYVKLNIANSDISELEKLLNNCQCLSGLVIYPFRTSEQYDWDNLFEVLARSSPNSLFRFKFHFGICLRPKLETLKLFFESWKGRHPMLLQALPMYSYLVFEYKVEGIIKNYDIDIKNDFEVFEWIQKRISYFKV